MNIKLVCLDFDGVFTDGKILFGNNIIKNYNIKDGKAISLFFKDDIDVRVISGFKYNKSTEEILNHLNIGDELYIEYKIPLIKDVLYTIVEKTKTFIVEAGKIILAISVILWFLATNGIGDRFDNPQDYVTQDIELMSENDLQSEIASIDFKDGPSDSP